MMPQHIHTHSDDLEGPIIPDLNKPFQDDDENLLDQGRKQKRFLEDLLDDESK